MSTFRAKGLTVFKDQVKRQNPDGSTTITMGFPLLLVADYITDGPAIAVEIAKALSAWPAFRDEPEDAS